jgi:hypothetical protein
MRRRSEYQRFADECRELARTMAREDQREALLRMAETWEQLGREAPEREVPERDLIEEHKDGKD